MNPTERLQMIDILKRLEELEKKTRGISRTERQKGFDGGNVRLTPGLADLEGDPSATDGRIYLAEASGERQVVFDFDSCSFKPAGKPPARSGLILDEVDTVGTTVSNK